MMKKRLRVAAAGDKGKKYDHNEDFYLLPGPSEKYEISAGVVEGKGSLLLCSDGLSDMVSDPDIQAILAAAGSDLPAVADRLVAAANENGGRDNITVMICEM